jgi:hypothetical protein
MTVSPSWSLDEDDEKENTLGGESEKKRPLLLPLLALSFAAVEGTLAAAEVADAGIDL